MYDSFGDMHGDSDSYNSISDDDSVGDDHSHDDHDDGENVDIGTNVGNDVNPEEVNPTSSDEQITVITDIEIEEEMENADDALTDNEFLTEEEWRQISRSFEL